MKLFGVINASPDSRHKQSIVTSSEEALKRAHWLLNSGADFLDLGGQGSTDDAFVVSPDLEWLRLQEILPSLAQLKVPMSIDTWKPEVAKKALDAGATIINAADGLQNEEMLQLAVEKNCLVVLPFLSGPDPRHMEKVQGDPISVLLKWFEKAIKRASALKIDHNLILDPGTVFAPPTWPWEERYAYQKCVYQNLFQLKCFHLPIYVSLPWKETDQHKELLDIILSQNIDYGRCHHPDRIRAAEQKLLGKNT